MLTQNLSVIWYLKQQIYCEITFKPFAMISSQPSCNEGVSPCYCGGWLGFSLFRRYFLGVGKLFTWSHDKPRSCGMWIWVALSPCPALASCPPVSRQAGRGTRPATVVWYSFLPTRLCIRLAHSCIILLNLMNNDYDVWQTTTM